MAKDIQENYLPGDEWLYYKIYTGPKTSEDILINSINPTANFFIDEGIINKWFFIRYPDPEYHLRVRFHCTDRKSVCLVMDRLLFDFHEYLSEFLIWKIELDTYKRELQRYGLNTIDVTEEIFYQDSKMVVNFFEMIRSNNNEELRWLFSLRAIDELLNCFDFSLFNKLEYIHGLRNQFAKEFGMSRFLKRQIDAKYRKERRNVNTFMYMQIENNSEYAPFLIALKNRTEEIKPKVLTILKLARNRKLSPNLAEVLASYLHMSINRIFKSQNRLHELICYDFLYRHYKSVLARENM